MLRTYAELVSFAGIGLLLMVAAGCKPTGPPRDYDAERRTQFRGEVEVERELVDANVVLPDYPLKENLVEVKFSGPKPPTM